MNTRIFTEHEREIIRRWLEKGEKLEGFQLLKWRIRNFKDLQEDIELIKKFEANLKEVKR